MSKRTKRDKILDVFDDNYDVHTKFDKEFIAEIQINDLDYLSEGKQKKRGTDISEERDKQIEKKLKEIEDRLEQKTFTADQEHVKFKNKEEHYHFEVLSSQECKEIARFRSSDFKERYKLISARDLGDIIWSNRFVDFETEINKPNKTVRKIGDVQIKFITLELKENYIYLVSVLDDIGEFYVCTCLLLEQKLGANNARKLDMVNINSGLVDNKPIKEEFIDFIASLKVRYVGHCYFLCPCYSK